MMKIAQHERFNWGDTTFEIVWKDDDGKSLVLRNIETRESKLVDVAVLQQAFLDSEACPIDIRPSDDHLTKSLVDLPKNDPGRIIAEYRLCYARPIVLGSMPVGRQEAYLSGIAKRYKHKTAPRPSTARRWAQQYKQFGEMALLDGRRLKIRDIAGMRK